MRQSVVYDKKPSSASLGADLKLILQQGTQAGSRAASLSGMSILLLPLPVTGLEITSKESITEQESSSYHNIDCATLLLCTIGNCLATVGAVTSDLIWLSILQENFEQHHFLFNGELKTTRGFNIVAVVSGICALLSGVLKMRLKSMKHRKYCHVFFVMSLITSFLSSMIAVAVWSDLISHGQSQLVLNKWTRPRGIKKIFGWPFWVMVAASLFLFFSNVCHLIRRDCKQKIEYDSASEE